MRGGGGVENMVKNDVVFLEPSCMGGLSVGLNRRGKGVEW